MGGHLPNEDVFLTTEEVLEYLQVNLRTVYRLIKAGKIPAVRVGRQWRFRRRDIDAWLDSQRAMPPGESPARGDAVPARSAPRSPAHGQADALGRCGRVLVVDDEASIREMLTRTLAYGAYDVETLSDARAALARLRESPDDYDLLIADLKMPGMDGLALIREVKQLPRQVPIIIITGFSSESAAIEAVNLGVSAYLTKPFRVPQVLAAAARALATP